MMHTGQEHNTATRLRERVDADGRMQARHVGRSGSRAARNQTFMRIYRDRARAPTSGRVGASTRDESALGASLKARTPAPARALYVLHVC